MFILAEHDFIDTSQEVHMQKIINYVFSVHTLQPRGSFGVYIMLLLLVDL